VPRALVTGATGLVGSHIVERLLADGWSVRALTRSAAPELIARGVDVVQGDVLDGDAFTRAAQQQDVVFHTAALITAAGNWESYRRLNVDGTTNAITAAEKSGARLLHLSSVAVYSARYQPGEDKIREDRAQGPLAEGAFYSRSKRESENLVLDAHARGRVWATAVRPDVIYGPRDRQFVPRLARLLRFGLAPVIGAGNTTLPVVHAANVADGAVLAATTDAAGGRAFNLANDFDVTVREFFVLAGVGLARRVRIIPIPLSVARTAYMVAASVIRLVAGGRASLLSGDALSMVTHDNPYDSSLARRVLGWTPRVQPSEGVPQSFRWWREHRSR